MKILDKLISFCSFKEGTTTKKNSFKKNKVSPKRAIREKLGFISFILLTFIFSSTAYAATLTVVTKYGDSGGNAGDLNSVGDKVNGNVICPSVNDYNNNVPGCDMSADVGYNDNGTPLDAADDYTEGDLIVRTNDLFNVHVAYGWLGNAGGAEEQVTLTGTLPAGKGFIWEGIPGSCKAGSSLSEDKKTVICVKKDFDTNDTGSFAEDMAFPVRVEGDAVNGSIPGDISFTVTDPTNSTPATDGVEDGNANQLLKITASPRWNIDKHAGPGYYTTSYGVTDEDGNPGWYLWYQFSIEVDEVDGTADDAPGRLGNEALQGGTDATVTFVDDISQISPNAKLVTWNANSKFDPPTNPCTMDYYTNSDEPYASYNAAYPDRSIKAPDNTMTVTCTPDGNGKVNVTVDHIDGTLTGAPTKNRNGGLLPVNRAIAAIGLMRIFVPVSDVELGEDGIANTADDGSLTTTNCVSDFNPLGISGGSNFGNSSSESEVDNCRNITLYSTAGSWDKNFRKGWSDQSVEIAKWGGGSWALPPTDASIVEGGDGTVTPGGVFGTYTVYNNTGGTTIDNPVLCDVIDVETYDMTVIDPNADNPGTFLDDTKHAVDLNYHTTESVPGLTIQYAVGYVGNWPPDPNEAPSTGTDEVVKECSDPSITWYPDYVTAAANGPVSKVRISAPTLPAGKLMAMRIKHTARSTYLSTKNGHMAGESIPNNEILVNHATYKSALTGNNYRRGDYYPKDASQNPGNGSGGGDRLIMVRAKVRIIKAMTPAAVSPGSEVTVTLESSFTTDGPSPETENVTITDMLPKGLTYTNGSTTGTYGDANTNFGEPTIISPVTDADCTAHAQDLMDNGQACGSFGGNDNNTNGGQSLLIWDLGNQVTGTVYEDLVFNAIVDVDAPTGTLKNYALIDSPADSSEPSKRISNANTNDSVPSSLLIVNSVQTPLHEVNSDSLLNWMQFRVGLRNGSSNTLTNLDVIDVIPFNGDGADGSFKFTPQVGTTVDRKRQPATNYHGSFVFDDVSLDDNGGQCTGTPTFWFTKTADPIDVSAIHPTNDVSVGSANWCGDADTVDAAIANCNFPNGKADVRAVRVRGVDMTPSGTCFINLKFATKENLDTDIYSNTAGAQALGVTSAVLSNTVSARVFASSVGDKVWFDENDDGIQDANENGVPGVVVKLLDSAGNPVKDPANPANDYEVTTDAFGNYKFENLQSGDYQVKFELDNSVITSQGSGGDTSLDSNADPATGIATVTLAENEDKTDIDAGIKQLSSIGDKVWNDLDRDGIQNAGELGVDGITVTLLDGSGNPILNNSDSPITTTTANGGEYKFDDLLPGTYSVGFSGLPADYVFSATNQGGDGAKDSDANVVTGKTGSVTVTPGQDITTLDAGINKIEEPPVAVDDSKSGLIPGTEGSINVVTNDTDPENNLDPSTVVITGSSVADAVISNGGKTITVPGEGVWNVAPDGTVTFTPDVNFTDDPTPIKYKVSDTEGKVSNEATITLDYDPLRKISGNVGIDIDDNDTADKSPLSPVTITLYEADGTTVVATTTTDSFGNYSFDVPGANYVVKETDLTGVTSVSDIDGANDNTIAVDATTSDVPGNDFVDEPVLGNVKGIVFIDGNSDGLFNNAEAQTISDIDIVVTDAYGVEHNISTSAVLNGNGEYEYDLTGLPVGPATVSVNTDDPDLPEGATPTTPIIATVAIPANASAEQDFGFKMPTSIGDTIWEDKNNDGVVDEGEALQGVEVTLTLPDGSTQTMVTDENGNYLFEDLSAGEYVVTVNESSLPESLRGRNTQDPDGGVGGVNDSTSAVTLDGENSNLDQDFAYHTPRGVVAGTVYEDTNGNGKQDPSEPGIANVKVLVTDIDGEVYELTTDNNGNYAQQVPIGNAVIDIDESTLPPSFTQTEGTDTTTVTVPEGGIANDVDGYKPPENAGAVKGVIYEDTNGNGVQDEGEPGIPGVKVVITDSTGGTHTVITDETGSYKETVPAGETIIAIDETTLPGGSIQTGGSNTSTVNVPEGGTATDEDGYQPPANAAKVKGIIFEDLDGNGIQDEGESGIPGVQVKITDSMGNTQTVTTDANGSYIATVPAGETTLDVDETTLPGGSTQTAGTDVTTVTVPEGGIAEDLDGYQPSDDSAQLTGVVYEDTNGNGIQDEDESGISGVDVTVTDSKGNIQTLITDADGKYRATVPAGSTLVDIDQSDIDYGYKQTEGSDPTIVIVPAGGIGTDVDGFKPPASIGDTIWNDKNNDGVVDEGEALQGVEVTLMLPDGSTQTTTTDENGQYLFNYLPEGEFTVTVDESTLPEELRGHNSQDPDAALNAKGDSKSTVLLDGTGNNHDQDFAYFVPGSIGDTIWHVKDNNGVVDEGEGLADITVKLTPPADIDLGNGLGVAITTTTGENGEYLFPNLPEGDYQVDVVEDSLPQALRGNNIVDPDGGNDSTSAVTLAVGDNNLDQDFAYYVPASIGDTIWEDKNNDGVVDEGEALQGVEVTLTLPDGSTQTMVTDENGNYLFEDLSAGEYVVTVNESSLPESLRGRNTQDPDGGVGGVNDSTSAVTLDGENSNLDQDFAYHTPRGVVAGTVYEDTNGNGKQDPSEPGIANVKVLVTDIDGEVYELTTDNNGNYAQQVPIGNAVIDIDESTLPPSFTQTEGTDTTTVTVPEGGIANDVDGYKPPENAGAVKGVIYEDTNGNGVQDADEKGIAGVSVTITDSTGGTQTLITDATGAYRATVPAGNTTIFIDESTLPGGSTQTQGSNSTTVVVPVNGIATDVDGYQPPDNAGKVKGVIFEDLNGDGIQNNGEVGIPGVQIKVTDSQGHVQILTTDQNGSYLATVPAGETELDIDESTLPGGSTQTVGTDVTTVNVPAGGIAVDLDGFKPADNNGLLTGVVYEDTNGNGVQDADEPGIAGVNVTVTDSEGNIQTLVTDAEGKYRATVPAGSTLVDIEQSDIAYGYVRTEGTDPTTVIVPAGGEGTDVDGFKPPLPGLVQIIKTAYGDDDVTIGHDEGAGCGTPRAQSQIILVDQDKSKDMPVTYCFEVTNIGDSYLTDINITDETLGVTHAELSLLNGPAPAGLAPGASLFYFYQMLATESLTNVASVSAVPSDENGKPTGGPVSSEGTSSAKVTLIIDPPSGLKTVTASGAVGMEWQMVWINDSDVAAPGVTVFDEVPVGTHFEAMPAGDFVSASGVYCEARGTSTTTAANDDNCFYEAPSGAYPRGRVIWKGIISADTGKHTEDEADNEVVIRFVSVLDNPTLPDQEIVNQGDSEWDFDNDGESDTEVKTESPEEDGGETVFVPANPIPTLSEWMLMLLVLLLLISGKRESMKLGGRKF